METAGNNGSRGRSAGNGGLETAGNNGSSSGNGGLETAGNNGGNSGNGANGQNNNGGFENGAGGNGGLEGNNTAGAAGGQGNGDDPFGDLSAGRQQVMTAEERRAALDERLNAGLAVFDGMILGERERVQAEADEAGSGVMSGTGGSGGDSDDGGGNSPLVIASSSNSTSGGGFMPANGNAGRQGDFSNANQEETFPVPDDIPSGNDDDVVAKQLREAAMHEPDPELREKLWDEYRNYTGIEKETK